MKEYFCIIFYCLILSTIFSKVSAVISLQLPGLTYATGTPTTIDIEFLDYKNNPLYTLKGEVFVQTLPMQANNVYIPDKLTGEQKFVAKIRILAGESGMVLKVFDTPTSTVPKLMILLKAGFLSSAATQKPIEIDFLGVDDHQTINEAEINWYNRDLSEFIRMKGMHVGKLEVHVERKEEAQFKPVGTFGVVYLQNDKLILPNAMNAVINQPSLIPQNGVNLPAAQQSQPQIYLNLPPQQQQQQQQGLSLAQSNSQFPNAPPLL